MKYLLSLIILLTLNACANDYYYENGKKVELTPIITPRALDSNIKYYKTINGRKIGIVNEILVKLKKDVEPNKFFQKYGIKNF